MRYTTTAVAVLLLLCACHENKSTPPPANYPAVTIAPPAPTGTEAATAFNNLLPEEGEAVQKFTVPHNRITVVTGRKGLKVTVNPAALCKKDGSPVLAAIEVEIKELATAMDMLLANAPTMSNGRMLESGGAYYVAMKSAGEALTLKAGNKLTMQLPRLSQKNMQLFYGQKNETGMVNWQPAATPFIPQTATAATKNRAMKFITNSREVRVKDSIATRPATLGECMSIYIDSFKKARFAYGIANRHRLSHRQEMHIYLHPVEFPFARFKRGIVKPRWGNESYKNSLSNMYRVPDTIPVYKEVPLKPVKEGEQVEAEGIEELNYYAPAEIERLGWINCDVFYEAPICRNVQINLADSSRMDACRVYYLFRDVNGVMAENFSSLPATGKIPVNCQLPVNTPVRVIVVGMRNNKLFTGSSTVVVKNNLGISLALKPLKGGSLADALKT